MYIFRVVDSEIITARTPADGTILLDTWVEVTEQQYLNHSALKAQMREDGRRDNPQFINDVVVIPIDTRTVIDVSIVDDEIKLSDFANITITLVNAPSYTGIQYLLAFGERFWFDFTNGTASRADILFPETGIYKFKSNGALKVQTPFNVGVSR